MKLIVVASKYLKRYPLLTAGALFSIITMSFFEGASFGMLIPLIQSMTTGTINSLGVIPFMSHFNLFLSPMNQWRAISFIFILLFLLVLIKNVFVYLSDMLIARLRF